MPSEQRWSVGRWMIAIALLAIIFYCGRLFYLSYVWMIKAGW